MYRKIAADMSAITLRPPPGTRFSIYGSDVELQYHDSQEGELFAWLEQWMNAYVKPLARRAAMPVPAETKPALLEDNSPESENNSGITIDAKGEFQQAPMIADAAPKPPLPTPSQLTELSMQLDIIIKQGGIEEALRRLKDASTTQDGIESETETDTSDEEKGE